jgi:hypothetical protein
MCQQRLYVGPFDTTQDVWCNGMIPGNDELVAAFVHHAHAHLALVALLTKAPAHNNVNIE